MLERQWREQCAQTPAGRDCAGAAPAAAAGVQPRRATLGLSGLPASDRGAAEHSGPQLAGAARALRPLRQAHQRPLSAGRGAHRSAERGRGVEVRLRLAGAGRAGPHLVPDRAHLHRRRSSAAAGRLTLPLLWVGLFLSLCAASAGGAAVPVDLRSSLIGAMAGYVSLWSVYHLFRLLTGKEGMGYGDFKLFAALGAWLGWQMLLPIILHRRRGRCRGRHRHHCRARPGARHAHPLRSVSRCRGLADADVRPAARRALPRPVPDAPVSSAPLERTSVPRRPDRRHRQRQVHAQRVSSRLSACRSSTATRWRATSSSPASRRWSGWSSASAAPSSRPTATSTGRRCATSCSPIPKARADLEALTHPAIGAAMEARSASGRRPLPDPRHSAAGREKSRLARRSRAGGRLRGGAAAARLHARDGSTPAAGAGHPRVRRHREPRA